MEPAETHRAACPNCATEFVGDYCHGCGQAQHIHRSIGAIWHDLIHGVLHLDGKFWRTLPELALRPGRLTRGYIDGRRARYVSPMGLFLFAVFAMFVAFSFVNPLFAEGMGSELGGEVSGYTASIQREIADNQASLDAAEAKLETVEADAPERDALLERIATRKEEANVLHGLIGEDQPYPDAIGPEGSETFMKGITIDTGWPAFDAALRDGIERANADPDLLFYKLQSNGYKFAWLLVPLSLPFVWIALLGKRGARFYDHAVFTTYSLSFMTLLFVVLSILSSAGVPDVVTGWLFALVPPLHLYKQLRHGYGLSRVGAVLRLIVLFFGIVIALTLFVVILFALGILG